MGTVRWGRPSLEFFGKTACNDFKEISCIDIDGYLSKLKKKEKKNFHHFDLILSVESRVGRSTNQA